MQDVDADRWECQDCHEITRAPDLLKAPHPFDADDTVSGCPVCMGMEFRLICDEPGCLSGASCGTPTAHGYRQTCGPHQPEFDREGWLLQRRTPAS